MYLHSFAALARPLVDVFTGDRASDERHRLDQRLVTNVVDSVLNAKKGKEEGNRDAWKLKRKFQKATRGTVTISWLLQCKGDQPHKDFSVKPATELPTNDTALISGSSQM